MKNVKQNIPATLEEPKFDTEHCNEPKLNLGDKILIDLFLGTEEKVDLILKHLGLEVDRTEEVFIPSKLILTKIKTNKGKKKKNTHSKRK